MNLRELNYNISMDGIFPSVEQFGGTQGDHNVTSLNMGIEDALYNSVVGSVGTGKAMCRFDVYDGEGGIWQSKARELERNLSLTLEERHTRFGGKITIYLVITSLSEDGKTEMELYSFPIELRLKNRPDGIYQDGENYESIVGLAHETKNQAEKAELSAQSAISANNEVQALAAEVDEKLKNGDFDGVGVKNAEIVDDELIITYTDDTSQNLGNVKGDTGQQGVKGDKGDEGPAGKDAITDQTYSAKSTNAQSGKAVAEALKNHYTKEEVNNLASIKYVMQDNETDVSLNSPRVDAYILVSDRNDIDIRTDYNINVNAVKIVNLATPENDSDAATKDYVDNAVANIGGGSAEYELVEEITLTETANVDKSTTPSGESYANIYKNMLITVFNANDKGCTYAYVYRGNDCVLTALSANQNEMVLVKTEMIAPDLAEWECYKRASTGYVSATSKGCADTSNNVSRVLVGGCTAGTVIKIYGMKA